jgi:hypothetical protein
MAPQSETRFRPHLARARINIRNLISGAGNGARTRDLNFGKVVVAGEGIYPFLRDFGLLILWETVAGQTPCRGDFRRND